MFLEEISPIKTQPDLGQKNFHLDPSLPIIDMFKQRILQVALKLIFKIKNNCETYTWRRC